MNRVLLLLILTGIGQASFAQYVYTIKADSVKITNSCDTAELIIENHTQTVPGFLYNKGRGRTEFRRVLQKISDTVVTIGPDTLRIPYAWIQGGNRWNTTGVFGTLDNNPIDFFTNNTRQGRWTNTGNLLLGSITDTGGYKLNVNGKLRAGRNSMIGAPDYESIDPRAIELKVLGNFQVVTGKTEGAYGGFAVYQDNWARPGATTMFLNDFAVTANDKIMHFGGPGSNFFRVYAAGDPNQLNGGPVTRTKYIIGNSSDPGTWNDSHVWFGVSDASEFSNISAYPSRANYYMLETRLSAPTVSSNTNQVAVRAPLRIGGRQIWFNTGDAAPGTRVARFTEGGNLLINTENDFGDKLHVAGDFVQEAGRAILAGDFAFTQVAEGCIMSSNRNFVYKSNGREDQHLFINPIGSFLKGTLVTIDPGGYVGQLDSQVVLKVKNKFGGLGLAVTMGGQVGIGTVPTASLHATGTIRFPDLTNNTSLTRVVVADANGNLFYRDAPWALNGAMNSDLAVNGTVSAQKMLLSQTGRWPDYVFSKQYHLPSLTEVENFIKQNNHLPGIPSAAEVEKKGIDVADTQAALLKKLEELTLYVIELEKRSQKQSEEIGELKKMIQKNK
jgi:hypothetical protein